MNVRAPSYWQLCASEPYRLFFPLATLVGISGVSLWPLFFSGLHKFYPGIMHARMMAEGFIGGYVLGFLATAAPKLLDARPLSSPGLGSLVALYLTSMGLHIGHQTRAGDAVFVGMFVVFAMMILRRWRRGVDLPPPAFVLVAFGLLAALAGPPLTIGASSGLIGGRTFYFGTLLLHQVFPLFLVLGVGAFLLPRFLGIGSFDPLDSERALNARWLRRASFAFVAGVSLLASAWMEAGDPMACASPVLRCAAVFVFLGGSIPFQRQSWPPSTVAIAAQCSLFALLAGLAFPLAWPAHRVAGLHVVFIGGFSVIIFAVATRVVLGHAGKGAQVRGPLPSLRIALSLLLAGAVLRAVGDFLVTLSQWLNGASYLWMCAAAIWGWCILRDVRTPDRADDSSNETNSPSPG